MRQNENNNRKCPWNVPSFRPFTQLFTFVCYSHPQSHSHMNMYAKTIIQYTSRCYESWLTSGPFCSGFLFFFFIVMLSVDWHARTKIILFSKQNEKIMIQVWFWSQLNFISEVGSGIRINNVICNTVWCLLLLSLLLDNWFCK